MIGFFGLLVSPSLHFKTSLTEFESYSLHGRGSVPNRAIQNPQCFGDSRDSKNDSIWGARREIQRRRRHAPSCMGATELQSNWPDMQKTLGKPGFCSTGFKKLTERTGLEQPAKSLGKSRFQNEAAQNPTRAVKQAAHGQRTRQRTSDGFRIQGPGGAPRFRNELPSTRLAATFRFLDATL